MIPIHPVETTRDRYVRKRTVLATRYGPQAMWPIVDNWALYVGVRHLARSLVLIRAAEHTMHVPGDIVEFGCWHGATLALWAKLLALFEPVSAKRVHGFDLWADGFDTSQWGIEDAAATAAKYTGWYRGDLDRLVDMLDLHELDRVTLYRGRIEETWPDARAGIPRVSLAPLDVDLYDPTRVALDGLHERLSPGAVILADEYGHPDWPGETKAVDEFIAAHPGCYEARAIRHAPHPTLWLERR